MTGNVVSKASSTLVGLATEIQAVLEDYKKRGMRLSSAMNIVDRKHLEQDVESMKLKTKDRRSDFFDGARDLLLEKTNEWFAFFHVQSS